MSTSSEGICQKHGISFSLCDCGPHAWLRASNHTTDEAFERELEDRPALGWEGSDGNRTWRAELKPVGFVLQVFVRECRDDARNLNYGWEVMDADCSTLRHHSYTQPLSQDEAFLAAEAAAVELLLEALAVFPCEEPRGFGTIEINERYRSGGPLGSFKASSVDAISLVRVILQQALSKKA